MSVCVCVWNGTPVCCGVSRWLLLSKPTDGGKRRGLGSHPFAILAQVPCWSVSRPLGEKNEAVSWLTPEIPQQTRLLSTVPSSLTFSGCVPYCKSKRQWLHPWDYANTFSYSFCDFATFWWEMEGLKWIMKWCERVTVDTVCTRGCATNNHYPSLWQTGL